MRGIGRVLAGVVLGVLAAGGADGLSAQGGVRRGPRAVPLPPGARLVRDVAYGPDRRQRFDVYVPARASGAPVVFMVHGGGWRRGDKAMPSVVRNKVARWVGAGIIVASANYRMLPDADPVEQARDVALALAAAQRQAATWGGDRSRFVLMGHSAGAHLVALVSSAPGATTGLELSPWLGAVLLDGAALDVVEVMEGRHMRLHAQAFGSDPGFWRAASPYHALERAPRPILAVCSTRRADACPQARRFVGRATALGGRASVLEVPLTHGEINERLGVPGSYTGSVESFLRTLHPSLAAALASPDRPGSVTRR